MAQKTALAQPKFIKVKDIESARSGYNVYVKIVSVQKREIQTRDGKLIPMVDAVVADQTGSAKAFFKGENANIIEKDNVIAIRNGVKRFIKNFISLEIDLFGRITLEKNININPSNTNNISEVEHKLQDKPRRRQQNRQGGYRRDNRDNRDNRDRNNEDRPRRNNRGQGRQDREDRRSDRKEGDREGNKRGGEQRSYRRDREGQERDRKPDNREGGQRRNNQSYADKRENRQPRRQYKRQADRDYDRGNNRTENREQKPYRNNNNRGGDRPYRNNDREERGDRNYDRTNNRNDRPPRQYEQKREQNRERRAPLTWNKIVDITPGEDRLNINVKVISSQKVGTRVRCVIGDETGISNAFLPESEYLHEGQYVVLFNARSEVVKEHIEIQLDRKGRVQKSRREVKSVSEEYNLSQKAWVPIE